MKKFNFVITINKMTTHKKRALIVVSILIMIFTGVYGLAIYYIIPKYIGNTDQRWEIDSFVATAYSIVITLTGLGLYVADYLDLIEI